jgi:hypothetical protein
VTFAEMQAAVYDDLNYGTAPSPNVVSRVKRWLNEGYLHLLREPGLTNLRQGSLSFSSVASQDVYGLPQAFDKAPDAIVQTTNNIRLQYRSRDWYRIVDPGQTDTGNPYVWMPAGLTPVLRQACGPCRQTRRTRWLRCSFRASGSAGRKSCSSARR